MRNVRLDQLLAGTMLAMIVATPQVSLAAPEGIRQIAPPPPSLNGQIIHRREAAPVPPAPIQQRIINVPEPVAQEPAKREPVVQAPPALEPATSAKADANDGDLSALDRPLAANDRQIA
ncbi:MAG: hypothetical protein PSV22_00115, partial [Pseudolabrys sp.]|nr:hypothetical protein [Pseudolabrys sp.]